MSLHGSLRWVEDKICDHVGEIRYDANGNPEPLPTALERAGSLFSALDKDNDGCLTKAEFMTGYTKRSTILRYGSLAIFCANDMLMHKILYPLSTVQEAGCRWPEEEAELPAAAGTCPEHPPRGDGLLHPLPDQRARAEDWGPPRQGGHRLLWGQEDGGGEEVSFYQVRIIDYRFSIFSWTQYYVLCSQICEPGAKDADMEQETCG